MRSIILFAIPLLTLIAGGGWIGSTETAIPIETERSKYGKQVGAPEPADTVEFNQEKALAELREKIKGREDRPSAEVYENIELFKQVPAGRLLRIMEMGFSRSLGVDCTHCHNPENFAGEDKPQKEITRQMMAMVGTINGELLAKIENLESEKPSVNCTTCHRGDVKPAQNLSQ